MTQETQLTPAHIQQIAHEALIAANPVVKVDVIEGCLHTTYLNGELQVQAIPTSSGGGE